MTIIYKVRIILDSKDDIFRDIEIDAGNSMEEFHNAIAQSFGFLGNEMASFYTCDKDWVQDGEIALFDMSESGLDVRLMGETYLEDVMDQTTTKLIYVYDFMSMWTFFVELADIVDNEPGRSYPNVLFSFGELPETPPEKNFRAESEFDYDDNPDNYDDMDLDENWN